MFDFDILTAHVLSLSTKLNGIRKMWRYPYCGFHRSFFKFLSASYWLRTNWRARRSIKFKLVGSTSNSSQREPQLSSFLFFYLLRVPNKWVEWVIVSSIVFIIQNFNGHSLQFEKTTTDWFRRNSVWYKVTFEYFRLNSNYLRKYFGFFFFV